MPPLLHPGPSRVLVVGFGAGSTPFGLRADPRLQSIDTVEICGSEYVLLAGLVFVASNEPLSLDLGALQDRFAGTSSAGLSERQPAVLRRFVETAHLVPVPPPEGRDDLNHDLFPRDEYGNW